MHAFWFGLFPFRSPLLWKSHVVFSSSGYLDVSVHRVPSAYLWIQYAVTEVFSARFPHSDISGSLDICSSPKLFAAYHVFHRLLVPRHPPYALSSITNLLVPAGTDTCYTCIALHALVIDFFKLIILTFSYNNYLGCLDIRYKFCRRFIYGKDF